MATYFFGCNVGASEFTVTEGAATTGKDIEIALNTTANVPNAHELLITMKKLANVIVRRGKQW